MCRWRTLRGQCSIIYAKILCKYHIMKLCPGSRSLFITHDIHTCGISGIHNREELGNSVAAPKLPYIFVETYTKNYRYPMILHFFNSFSKK